MTIEIIDRRSGRTVLVGPAIAAKFVRGGALVIVFDFETTSCYDMETGKRVWARGKERWFADPEMGTVDRAGELCMVQTEADLPAVVSLGTGELLGAVESGMVASRGVIVVEGEEAAIVATSDGELRRVELGTGATSARAASMGTGKLSFPTPTAVGHLMTAVEGGRSWCAT